MEKFIARYNGIYDAVCNLQNSHALNTSDCNNVSTGCN